MHAVPATRGRSRRWDGESGEVWKGEVDIVVVKCTCYTIGKTQTLGFSVEYRRNEHQTKGIICKSDPFQARK